MPKSHENLKTIHFEGEMLPKWAQLLDLAAQLCVVPQETQSWFSRFTNSTGVDDARTIVIQSETLLAAIHENKETISHELERTRDDSQARQIIAAWEYTLDTMIQVARARKACSWKIEGSEATSDGDFGDGDITLRRV